MSDRSLSTRSNQYLAQEVAIEPHSQSSAHAGFNSKCDSMHQSTGGSRRKHGRKCESDWSGIWFRYQSHFVLFVSDGASSSVRRGLFLCSCPHRSICFNSSWASSSISLCFSPRLQAAGHYQDITCVGMCNSMRTHTHTHTQKCNTLLRWPYVVHLTNKPTHWASHAGITCPFPGTISFFPCYWFNWHAKLTLTLFVSIPFPSAYLSPLKQLSLLIFISRSSPLSLNLSYFQGRSERAGERVIYSVYMKGALDHFINLWLR